MTNAQFAMACYIAWCCISDKFLFDSLDALWWNIIHTLEGNLFMAVTTCQEVSYIHTEKAISPIYERRAECQEYLSNFMA